MADTKTEMVDIHAKIISNLLSESKEVPRKKKNHRWSEEWCQRKQEPMRRGVNSQSKNKLNNQIAAVLNYNQKLKVTIQVSTLVKINDGIGFL